MILSIIIFFIFFVGLLVFSLNYNSNSTWITPTKHPESYVTLPEPHHRQQQDYSFAPLFPGGYGAYLVSSAWAAIKMLVNERDKTCTRCNATTALQVHHRTYRNVYFEELCLSDLTLLCSKCHSAIDHTEILLTWPGENYQPLPDQSTLSEPKQLTGRTRKRGMKPLTPEQRIATNSH